MKTASLCKPALAGTARHATTGAAPARQPRVTARAAFARHALAAVLLAALPWAAQAHRTWLLPTATVVEGKDPVAVIDGAVSEDLFVFEHALQLDKLSAIGPKGETLAPEAVTTARHRSSFEVKLGEPGTYRIGNLSRQAMASWKVGDETKRWRGKPEELAKAVPAGAQVLGVTVADNRLETFVSRDEPGASVPPAPADGLALQPLDPVTDLSSGDSTRFVLLMDGKPLADTVVTVLRGGNRYRYKLGELTLRTDAKGQFIVAWPEPGQYWIGASWSAARPEGGAPGTGGTVEAPLRRAGYAATFEVLPR